jgi:hypothetical protein
VPQCALSDQVLCFRVAGREQRSRARPVGRDSLIPPNTWHAAYYVKIGSDRIELGTPRTSMGTCKGSRTITAAFSIATTSVHRGWKPFKLGSEGRNWIMTDRAGSRPERRSISTEQHAQLPFPVLHPTNI